MSYLHFKLGTPLPSFERNRYRHPSLVYIPKTTGGPPARDPFYKKDETHKPEYRTDSERFNSVIVNEQPEYSENHESKQVGFVPGTKEPAQTSQEYYPQDIQHSPDPAREISWLTFFTTLSKSLGPAEIYGEFAYPSRGLRHLNAIGIEPQSERTIVGKVNLAVMMRIYLSTIRRDLVLFASRCEDRRNSSLDPMDHKSMMEAGQLL